MRKRAFGLRFILTVLYLLAPATLAAQNLVLNPNFDIGFLFWNTSSGPGCTGCAFVVDGVNGYPTTPSAGLSSTTPGNAGQSLTSGCTSYTALPSMDLGASEHDNGSVGTFQSQIFFTFWSDSACTLFTGSASLVNLGAPAPGWIRWGINGFTPPAPTGFFTVGMQARLNGSNPGIGDFSYDHIYLGPPGTTPLELKSFHAE